MNLRREKQGDAAATRDIVIAAFGQAPEADLVDSLRDTGDVELSLVAEDDGELIGHVLISKLQTPDKCLALALAPVSVSPHRQCQGVGSRLVREALEVATQAGWEAVFLLGDPAEPVNDFETPTVTIY